MRHLRSTRKPIHHTSCHEVERWDITYSPAGTLKMTVLGTMSSSSCFVIPYLRADLLKAACGHPGPLTDSCSLAAGSLSRDTFCPPQWVMQCYLSDGCSPIEYAVYLLRPGFMVSEVEPNIYYWGMTSRHIVIVSWWNIHVWHFAQQNLLLEEMMNSPWWDKTTAELPESSRKKYYFVPLEAFRYSKIAAQGHALTFLAVPQKERPWPWVVAYCPTACVWFHLFVPQFLSDLEIRTFSQFPLKVSFQAQNNHNHS